MHLARNAHSRSRSCTPPATSPQQQRGRALVRTANKRMPAVVTPAFNVLRCLRLACGWLASDPWPVEQCTGALPVPDQPWLPCPLLLPLALLQVRLQEVPPDTPAGRTRLTFSDLELERRWVLKGCGCWGCWVLMGAEFVGAATQGAGGMTHCCMPRRLND